MAEACLFQLGEALFTTVASLLVRRLDVSLPDVLKKRVLDFIRIVLS